MSNVIKTILLQGPRIIVSYFLWMRKYAKKKEKYHIKLKYNRLRKLCLRIFKSLNGELDVKGLENVPHQTVCFVSNHINLSDPLIYIVALNAPTTFVCKKEIASYPFVAKCVEDIEGEFIDRNNLKESLRTMMKVEASLKEGTKNWLIFPEGTRNKDSRALLLDFHHGTFRAPMKAEVPIIPCAIYGTHRLVSKKYKFKKYPVYLEFGKPLMPEEYKSMSTVEVANMMHSKIQQMMSYHARQEDKKALVNLLGDKYLEKY